GHVQGVSAVLVGAAGGLWLTPPQDADTDGQAAVLEQWVEEHHDFVWRLVRRIIAREGDVDDLVQKTFLIALRKLDAIEPGRTRAFLAGTAVRVASEHRRTVRRRREAADDTGDLASPAEGVEELVDQKKARALLDDILARLTPDLREVLVLFEIEELSGPQSAELLGIAEGTEAPRIRRARYALVEGG